MAFGWGQVKCGAAGDHSVVQRSNNVTEVALTSYASRRSGQVECSPPMKLTILAR
jgi:hypothetical protein